MRFNIDNLLKEKEKSYTQLSLDVGFSRAYIYKVNKGEWIPNSMFVANVASIFEVPVSRVVKFDDIEYRDNFAEKEWTGRKGTGRLSYAPLYEVLKFYYPNNEKTLDDLFDKIPEEHKQGRRFIKFQPVGLSKTTRLRFKHNCEVSMNVIYEMCKLLKCNVDYVMEWV